MPLAMAAALAFFVAGVQWARFGVTRAERAQNFVLLLQEDEAFRPTASGDELVREHTAWAEELARRGALVLADKLDPRAASTDGLRDSSSLGPLTGLFIVRAPDAAAAIQLARSHPHVKYGGRIVVRGIVRR
ncbi:MAG: YciI family protein [Gemmatimonadales bacterium]|nr:YciI family protein [Gemmatimonadales bacterium]